MILKSDTYEQNGLIHVHNAADNNRFVVVKRMINQNANKRAKMEKPFYHSKSIATLGRGFILASDGARLELPFKTQVTPTSPLSVYADYQPIGIYGSALGVSCLRDDHQDFVSNVQDLAFERLLNSLKGRSIGVGHDALVDFFEAPEMRRLRDSIHKAITALETDKKLRRYLTRAPKGVVIGEAYLAYKFGIEPLVNSIHECLSTFRNADFETMLNGYARGKKHDYYDHQSITETESYVPGYGSVKYRTTSDTSFSIRNSYHCHFTVKNFELLLGAMFGLDTPFASFYMSLPLSFVLDWFINIGHYFARIEALSKMKKEIHVVSVTNSVKTWLQTINTYSAIAEDDTVLFNISNSYVERAYVRTVTNTLPGTVKLPGFNPRLSAGKLTSLGFLAQAMLRR